MTVPQLIFSAGRQITGERVLAGLASLESAFYASLKGPSANKGIVHSIKETTVAHVQTLQFLFNAVNMGAVVYYATKLVNEVSWIKPTSLPWKIVSIVLASTIPMSIGVVLINRFATSPAIKESHGEIDISESRALQKSTAKALHVSKLILTAALTCFSQNRLWYALTLAGTGYSLAKNMQLKWVDFSRTFSENLAEPMKEVKVTFPLLELPLDKQARCDDCFTYPLQTAYCASHVFCRTCMAAKAEVATSNFIPNADLTKKRFDHHSDHGLRVSFAYVGTVPPENHLSCPDCPKFPLKYESDVTVTEMDGQKFPGSVAVQGPSASYQHIFENLYAVYNVVQAGLAYLQKYPELAAPIFQIQKIMVIPDFIGAGQSTYYLFRRVREKIDDAHAILFNVTAAVTVVASAALSYFAALRINSLLKPTLDLSQFITKPEGINFCWNSPTIHKIMQALFIYRIVTMKALSFFSRQRKTGLLSVAAQTYSLIGISRLRWIEFTQLIEKPLERALATQGKLSDRITTESLTNLRSTSHFLVPPGATVKPSALQSICDYVNTLFDKASWSRKWITSRDSRQLIYIATVQNNSFEASGVTLTDRWTRGLDSRYGSTEVVIG